MTYFSMNTVCKIDWCRTVWKGFHVSGRSKAIYLLGKKIKVCASRLAENPGRAAPGTVLALKPLTVACGEGAVTLESVTPEGGKPMTGTAWAAGRRLKAGDSL